MKITEFDKPFFFTDEMLSGAFKSMKHTHRFEEINNQTEMSDHFEFEAPFGVLGRIVEKLFLTKYMETFLLERNEVLKDLAESEQWKPFLKKKSKV